MVAKPNPPKTHTPNGRLYEATIMALELAERADVIVVGSGITGLTIAERAAAGGSKVLVVDRREHLGGNCYDSPDEHGLLVHRYGPHIFHTASEKVYEYLSQFTAWRPYEHRVVTRYQDKLLPMPVNADTLEMFFEISPFLNEEECAGFLADKQIPCERPQSSEDVCLARVGPELYEALFKPYTIKQWGRDPSELDRSVCGRIPVRTDYEDRYFTDKYQVMPEDGYTAMFRQMIDRHDDLDVVTGIEGAPFRSFAEEKPVVWTGPLDEAFDFRHGQLPWRSLRFELVYAKTPGGERAQPAAVVNEASGDVPYTRTTEYRWLTGEKGPVSPMHREYPDPDGEPYYPVPAPLANELAQRYRDEAKGSNLIVCGRLGRYQYLEMGQAVASALKTFEENRERLCPRGQETDILDVRNIPN